MASHFRMGSRRSGWLALTGILALGAGAGLVWRPKPPSPIDSLEWVIVERDDLDTTLLAGGDLQPAKQTMVSCQVEDITDTEGNLVLTVIDNGARVKKGDVLCRLDSSELEELARQQEIQVGQTRALCLSAQLVFETAQIALREYEQGLAVQFTKEFESKIALSRSDTQRQVDRLAWATAMASKGYLAQSQLLSERQALARTRHELAKIEGEFHVFSRFHAPKEIRALRSEIETAEKNYEVQAAALKAEEGRLAYIRKQIDNCTVRSPQDGVVVHVNGSRWRPSPLEPGTLVFQEQHLFMIPDLTSMEVEVSVNETMAPRLRLGMKANVRIASMADRVLTGRVVAIDMLPSPDWKTWDENVRHFFVRVRLDNTPASALPLMSAQVEFDTGHVAGALVIPAEAMAMVDGQESCYVVSEQGLERRPIKTRRATPDLLEITRGLTEGERVVARSLAVAGIPVESLAGRSQSQGPASPEEPAHLAGESVRMRAGAG
jgi:HlyD family secretion protein